MTFDVLAIGNPVYDIIITPYVRSGRRILSGCSINALLTLRRLGFSRLALVGTVGRDFINQLKRELRHYGIGHFTLIEAPHTGGFELIYDDKGNRELRVLGIAGCITEHDIPDEYLDCKYILLGPILNEIDIKLIEYLSTTSKAELFLDPQGLTRRVTEERSIRHSCDYRLIREIVKMVDYVKPNEIESLVMTRIRNPFKAVELLVNWGAKVGIVTLAERGSIVYDGSLFYRIPAYKTTALDPTGAGDVYAGGFIAKRLEGGSIAVACLFASATASIKVEHCGPNFPVTQREAQRRYNAIASRLKVYESVNEAKE